MVVMQEKLLCKSKLAPSIAAPPWRYYVSKGQHFHDIILYSPQHQENLRQNSGKMG
jgi:hypothetical protein